MAECIIKISNGCIYLPKKFLIKAGIKPNERVILRVTEHGMAFCKVGLMDELELFFKELDNELQKGISLSEFIKAKNKQLEDDGL